MLALTPRFRCACSATPIKQPIDQTDCFVPSSGIEPASTVLQTVALPFKLQRRRTTDCYGIWVIGPSLVRRTSMFFSSLFRARPEEVAAAYRQLEKTSAYAWRFTKHRAPTELRYPDPVLKRHLLFL